MAERSFVQRDGVESSKKGHVQQLYLFASGITGFAGKQIARSKNRNGKFNSVDAVGDRVKKDRDYNGDKQYFEAVYEWSFG